MTFFVIVLISYVLFNRWCGDKFGDNSKNTTYCHLLTLFVSIHIYIRVDTLYVKKKKVNTLLYLCMCVADIRKSSQLYSSIILLISYFL